MNNCDTLPYTFKGASHTNFTFTLKTSQNVGKVSLSWYSVSCFVMQEPTEKQLLLLILRCATVSLLQLKHTSTHLEEGLRSFLRPFTRSLSLSLALPRTGLLLRDFWRRLLSRLRLRLRPLTPLSQGVNACNLTHAPKLSME